MDELIRQFQLTAARLGQIAAPGSTPATVEVHAPDGCLLFVLCIPPEARVGAFGAGLVPQTPPAPGRGPPVAGWEVADRLATYDGQPVKVAPCRLGLLRELVAAREPVPAARLVRVFGAVTSEENVRYHISQLNKELKSAFPDLDYTPVTPTGEGYVLAFR